MGGMFQFDCIGMEALVITKEDIYYLVDSTLSMLHQLENYDNILTKED